MAFTKVVLVVLLGAMTAARAWGQENTYYVNYWCSEWKKSDKLKFAQASKRAEVLKQLGAETDIVDVTSPADIPQFPNPKLDYRVHQVQFRLTAVKSLRLKDEDDPLKLVVSFKKYDIDAQFTTRTPLDEKVRALVFPLQAYGMDVQVTSKSPLREIPKEAATEIKLPKESVWIGTIFQRDRELPARLELKQAGGLLLGELSFTFQPRDLLNRPVPKKSYKAEVKGEVKDGAIILTATKALEGNVYIPTTYTLKLSDAKSMKGQWKAQSEKNDITLTLSEALKN